MHAGVVKINAVETNSLKLTNYPYKSELDGVSVASIVSG